MYALMCKHGYTQIDMCYCDGLAHSFIAFWPVDFITYNCNYFLVSRLLDRNFQRF